LTRNFLVKQIETTRGLGSVLGNNNTPPNMGFTVNEMGTLLGVEESYHSYQMMVLADRYTQADKSAASQFMDAAADTEEARTAYYNENAVERGARQVVADAARHYGLGKRLASLEATLEN
ncbi:MAG TPA: hypothetical protein PLO23_08140, partial [Alphaproteobacteria bacterium]|nr:hypothetical protein [Alphaproteobacteria bacterium]